MVSLFTKTPITVTVHIVHDRLKKDRTLQKRTSLTTEDITRLLDFVSTSTYFQYRGSIYRQKEGFAMGDPLSAIMSGFFMEDLEALSTAQGHCGLSLWKRYVGDILEIIKTGHSQELTDHLNTLDKTNSIKFTHEERNRQNNTLFGPGHKTFGRWQHKNPHILKTHSHRSIPPLDIRTSHKSNYPL